MSQCIAFRCKNKGVHPLPTDTTRRNQWIEALRLKPCTQNSSTALFRLCADHFDPDDYEDTGVPNERVLKKDAIPSLFSPSRVPVKPSRRRGRPRLVQNTELDSTQPGKASVGENGNSVTRYGHCQCCLKEAAHSYGNVREMLKCFNVKMSSDPRIPQLICSDCGKFLQQARDFREMVVATQRRLRALYEDAGDGRGPDTGQVKEELGGTDEPNLTKIQRYKKEHKMAAKRLKSESTELPGAVKQEIMKLETGMPSTEMEGASDGVMDHDGGFSDDTDIENDIKEDKPKLTAQEVKNNTKIMELQLNLQIRENLSTILQNSTIIPFTNVKGDQFECIYCDKNYIHFFELRNHVETKHDEEEYEFKFKALSLVPELILRADVSFIKCRLCEERFRTVDSLVQHLIHIHDKKYHNISRDPPHNVLCFDMSLDCLKCLDCGKTFTYFRGLLMHMNQHYGSYLCPDCGSKFLYEHTYKLHMYQEKKRDLPKAQCMFCEASYVRKNHLKRHMKVKHPNRPMTL